MARDLMLDPVHYATMMVQQGDAGGFVSGSTHSTADTLGPVLRVIKTREGVGLASSIFFMCLPDHVLVYGDCALVENPTAEQMADIAITSAETARAFGIEPRVALLSYSTGQSGKGKDVDKVREAARLARERRPDLPIVWACRTEPPSPAGRGLTSCAPSLTPTAVTSADRSR